MGIFDRFADRLERNNAAAVFEAAAEQLETAIEAHIKQLASLRVRRERGEEGYGPLVAEAEQVLVDLRAQREALRVERVSAPAEKVLAEARVALHDEATGLGASATSASLASVREDIGAINRRAHPNLLDPDGIPIVGRQARMNQQIRDDDARAQLAELKRQRAAAKAPEVDPSEGDS